MLADRFWSNVIRASENECWIWTGCRTPEGYGTLSIENRQVRAHRQSIILDGRDIPAGMVVDHVCRNRACVNPHHLRVVTRRQNVHENSVALAHLNSLKEQCLRGHPLSGKNLILDRGTRRCRRCKNEQRRAVHARKRLAPKDASAVPSGMRPNPTDTTHQGVKTDG